MIDFVYIAKIGNYLYDVFNFNFILFYKQVKGFDFQDAGLAR